MSSRCVVRSPLAPRGSVAAAGASGIVEILGFATIITWHSILILADSILSVYYAVETRKMEYNRTCQLEAQQRAAGHDVNVLHEPQHNFAGSVGLLGY